MAEAGSEGLNLATLWLPIVPEVSQLEGKGREAGEKFRRGFNEGFKGLGTDAGQMGATSGANFSKGFNEHTQSNMSAGMSKAFAGMQSMAGTASVAMGNLIAKGIEEAFKVGVEVAEKAFELVVEGAKKAAEEILKIGEAFEAIDRQLKIFSGDSGFEQAITYIGNINSGLGDVLKTQEQLHDEMLRTTAVDVFRRLDTDAHDLGETIGILNARFSQFQGNLSKVTPGFASSFIDPDQLKELAYDLTEVGDRMGKIDVRAFSSAMMQFGVDGNHASAVLRVVTHDAKDAGVSIQELTSSMVESGPILSELGVDADSASSGLAKIAAMGDSATQTTRGILNVAQEAGKGQQDLKQNLEDTAAALQHYQAIINDPNASQGQKDQARQNAEQLALAEGGKKNWAELMQVLPHIIDMLNGVDSASQRAAVSAAAIAAGLPDPYSQGTLQKWFDATQDLRNKWRALTNDMKASLEGVGVGVVHFIATGLGGIQKWFDSNHAQIIAKVEKIGDAFIDNLPKIKDFIITGIRLFTYFVDAVLVLLAPIIVGLTTAGAAALALMGHFSEAADLLKSPVEFYFKTGEATRKIDDLLDKVQGLKLPDGMQQRLKDQLHGALNPPPTPGAAPPGADTGQPAGPAPAGPAPAGPAPAPAAPGPAPAPSPPPAPVGPPIVEGPSGPDQRQYAPHPAATSGYTVPSAPSAPSGVTLAGFSIPAGPPGTAHPLAANPIVRMAASALGGLTGMDANSVLGMLGLGQQAQQGKGGTTVSQTAPPLAPNLLADSYSASPYSTDVMGPAGATPGQIGSGHGIGYDTARSTDAYGQPADNSGGATLAGSYSSTGQQAQLASVDQPAGPGPARPPAGWQADAYDYIQTRGKAMGLSPTEINATEAVAKHESNWQSTGFMGFGPEAHAAGMNFDGNPHAAIDQFLDQYTSRRQQGGALNPNDPQSVASYIHHTVHHAADPNYTQELLTTMGGSGPARPSPAQTASYTQPVGLGAFPANPGATDTATSGSPRYGGIPGAPSGTGQNIIGYMEAQVAAYNQATGSNLSISATYPGGPFGGHSDDGGDHSARRAVDISGGAQQMTAFAHYWDSHPELVAATRQLIHEGPGFSDSENIFGGQFRSGTGIYGAGTMSEHANHVHLAMESIPGMVGAPGVAGSNNIVLADAVQPAGGTGAAVAGTPQQIQSDIDRRETARRLADANDAVDDAKENVKKTQKTVDDTQKANDDLHNQLNSMDPKDPRRRDVQDQAEKNKATDEDLAAAKRLHEKAIRDEGSAEDALTIQKEKAELPPKAEKGESKGGAEGAADELGRGFLGGIASDLGMGNILGGKSPDKWAAVQIAGGLFGIIMKHLFPNGFGGGIPGIGGQPGIPAAPDTSGGDGSSNGAFPGTPPPDVGPAPGPGSGGSGQGGAIPALPPGTDHMPGQAPAPSNQGDGSGGPQPPAPANTGGGAQPPAPGGGAQPPAPPAPGGGQPPPHPGGALPVPSGLLPAPTGGAAPLPAIHWDTGRGGWVDTGGQMVDPAKAPGHPGFDPRGPATPGASHTATTQGHPADPNHMSWNDATRALFGAGGPLSFGPGDPPPAPHIDQPPRPAPVPAVPHAANQSFVGPQNAPNVVPGGGQQATLAGAFTPAPQPLQPVGQPQATSVTHNYDHSIGSITAHDPQEAVRAIQETHNSRFYTITGGLPRPSVGV